MPSLDFDALRKSVKKGEILPAYYFHGDEDLLKDDTLRDLIGAALDPATRDFNLDRRTVGDLAPDDFATLVQTPPMMAPRRGVVLAGAEQLQQRRPRSQALRAAILDYLSHPASDTLLVLVQGAGEKPDSDIARLAASVEFRSLTPDKLERWIRHRAQQEGLELDEDGSRHLHAAVGDDLPQLAAEIAKLRSAVAGRPATANDVADLVGVRRGETVNDFVDAVTSRRIPDALGMVRHLLDGPGVSGVRLLTSLGIALTGTALARALLDQAGNKPIVGDIKQALFSSRPWGLRGYEEEAARWARDARQWTVAELDRAMAALLRADKRLKNTSVAGETEIIVDALLTMSREPASA